MSPKSIWFYSVKMSLFKYNIGKPHLFHGPVDIGTPDPSGHPVFAGKHLTSGGCFRLNILPDGPSPYQQAFAA